MLRYFAFISLLLLLPCAVQAQGYDTFLANGKQAQSELDYDFAIRSFKAAQVAANSPAQRQEATDFLEQANTQWRNALIQARQEAEEAKVIAEAARDTARAEARRSEANRLGYLASVENDRGNGEDALNLSFRAMQMLEPERLQSVVRSYGDASFLNYHKLLEGHESDILTMAISPNSDYVITGDLQGNLRRWDMDGKSRGTLKSHNAPVRQAAFSADGSLLTTAGRDAPMIHRDKGDAGQLSGHEQAITFAAFAPDGSRIVTCSRDNTAKVWDAAGNQVATLSGHTAPLQEAAISPDGRTIVTFALDKTARLWTIEGEPVATLSGHQSYLYDVNFSNNGQNVVTISADKTVKVWRRDGTLISTYEHDDPVVTAVSDIGDSQIVTGTTGGRITIWGADGKKKSRTKLGSRVQSIIRSPDGARFVVLMKNAFVYLYNSAGEQITVIDQHRDRANGAVFSPVSNELLTYSQDGSVRLWDQDGTLLMAPENFGGEVLSAGFSQDGSYIWACSADGTAWFCQLPALTYAELSKTGVPDLNDDQKRKYGLEE